MATTSSPASSRLSIGFTKVASKGRSSTRGARRALPTRVVTPRTAARRLQQHLQRGHEPAGGWPLHGRDDRQGQLAADAINGAQHVLAGPLLSRSIVGATTTSVEATPDRWLKQGEAASATVRGTDSGSGVKSFELAFPGGAPATVTRACSGLTPPGRCASSDQAAFDYLTDGPRFPEEGRTQVRGTVVDAVGRRSLPSATRCGSIVPSSADSGRRPVLLAQHDPRTR